MAMYKVLKEDLTSWYDGKTKWTPGKWMPLIKNESDANECGTGYHLGLSLNAAMRYGKMPCRIWSAEGKKKYGEGSDKKRYGRARIIKEITPYYITAVNAFISSIKAVRWFQQCKRPLKSWRLFDTRAAAVDAARAARIAARVAARVAAVDATWAAARDAARDAAVDAAWPAAWAAAVDAAWAAAVDAAWAAARDAALMARFIICDGLPLDKKHIAHAKARWEVWKRGYGLLCDIGGVLYVYEKP